VAVTVSRFVELAALDRDLGLEPGRLAALNPALRSGTTPKGAYDLRVPEPIAQAVPAVVDSVPIYVPPQPEVLVHRVRRGETLSGIASRYRSSVTAILRWNRLASAHRIKPGQALRIPLH
jgi:membrane-bound lytic murein transglycosylase D